MARARVLGLGDVGPQAARPLMEGKALLFKYLGGVDAVPICLDTSDPDQLVRTVELLAGLLNASRVVGKDLRRMRIAMVGMGAANVYKVCAIRLEAAPMESPGRG